MSARSSRAPSSAAASSPPTASPRFERAVEDAVRRTNPGPPETLHKPRRDHAAVWTAGELAKQVKNVSNWTDVADHRSKYYLIEQERKAADFERRKVELRHNLDHMKRTERDREHASQQIQREEARQVSADLEAFYAEQAKAKEALTAKALQQKKDRDAQLREQSARAAAAVRLRQLEDEELLAHLAKEEAAAKEKALAKQRANEEYHRQTALANIKAREDRKAAKELEWARDQKLNEEWKAVLQKAEDARNAQYEGLRERIRQMQRVYEDNAGAEEEAKMKMEEERRERHLEAERLRLDELDRRKKEQRAEMVAATTRSIFDQMRRQEEERKAERLADERYAQTVIADTKLEQAREAQKKDLARARALNQQSFLNEQVALIKANKANDPGASEMTALEASINRGLLVSIVQHKYPNPHVLN